MKRHNMTAKGKMIIFTGFVVAILLTITLIYRYKPLTYLPTIFSETEKKNPRSSDEKIKPADMVKETQPFTPNSPQRVETNSIGSEVLLEDVAREVIERIKPIEWHRQEFDGKAERFSDKDFAEAKKVVSAYLDNFRKIRTITFEEEKTTTALVDNEFTRLYMEKRKGADNHSINVEITRSPLYFKMTGVTGDGAELEEIITPAGKISSGHLGRGASWIPPYLDGEKTFTERIILKYSESVRENVSMDYDLPELKEFVKAKNSEKVKYDVIERTESDVGIRRSYWFNRETEMLDFIVEVKLDPKKDAQFYGATFIDYYKHNDIYYPKRSISYGLDYQIKTEENITNLVINGVAVP